MEAFNLSYLLCMARSTRHLATWKLILIILDSFFLGGAILLHLRSYGCDWLL